MGTTDTLTKSKPSRRTSARTATVSSIPIEEMLHYYMAAFELRDRQMLENILSPDFLFTSPEDDHIDRKTFFKKYWDSHINHAIFIERVFERGNEAYIQYCMEQAGHKRTRKVAFVTFSANKIEKVCAYVGQDLSASPVYETATD